MSFKLAAGMRQSYNLCAALKTSVWTKKFSHWFHSASPEWATPEIFGGHGHGRRRLPKSRPALH